jgi:hypothetical protein
MAQPKAFLVQVLVFFNPDGTFTKEIRSLYDGKDITNKVLGVNVGDRVAWMVQGVVGGNYNLLPFNITFNNKQTNAPDTAFFGVSSLNMPSGGPSTFLHVLSLEALIKYTVVVPGIITIDPDIQSGGDTGTMGQHAEVAPVSYVVSWDTSNPNNTMTYSAGGGPSQPLPLPVADNDQVTFNAVVQGGAAATNFIIKFKPGNGWPSPFSSQHGTFGPNGAATSLGPYPVKDTLDPGAQFPFTASITLNGHDIGPSSNPNNYITITASPKKHADARRHDEEHERSES